MEEYRRLGIGGLVGDLVEWMVKSVEGRGDGVRFGLFGCYDIMFVGMLVSLGVFGMERWVLFISYVVVELFMDNMKGGRERGGWFGGLFGKGKEIGRWLVEELGEEEKKKLEGYYVRLRYNDEVVIVFGCRMEGRYLEGDELFCILVSEI